MFIEYQEVRYFIIISIPIIIILRAIVDIINIYFSKSRDPKSKLPWANYVSTIELSRLGLKIIIPTQILVRQTVSYIYIYIYIDHSYSYCDSLLGLVLFFNIPPI